VRTIPAFHSLTVEIHIEAGVDVTAVDVALRQLQTKIGERLVSRTFLRAFGALDSAFDLSVKESKNETFFRFGVLEPGLLRCWKRFDRTLLLRETIYKSSQEMEIVLTYN
jgi:hypothetical protein